MLMGDDQAAGSYLLPENLTQQQYGVLLRQTAALLSSKYGLDAAMQVGAGSLFGVWARCRGCWSVEVVDALELPARACRGWATPC